MHSSRPFHWYLSFQGVHQTFVQLIGIREKLSQFSNADSIKNGPPAEYTGAFDLIAARYLSILVLVSRQ
jgi:hypothetical protein